MEGDCHIAAGLAVFATLLIVALIVALIECLINKGE